MSDPQGPIGPNEAIKVTNIETFVLKNSWVFVKISTDAGITGWGEMLKDDAKACAAGALEVADYLVGKDPRPVVHHWQAIHRGAFYRGGPIKTAILSGIEADRLAACIRDDDPIVFFEHKGLYGISGPVPEEPYVLPIGKARTIREGTDITLVGISKMTWVANDAAEALAKEGISCEVIDLLSISPIDYDHIMKLVGDNAGRAYIAFCVGHSKGILEGLKSS